MYPNPLGPNSRLTVNLGAPCEEAQLLLTDLRGAKLATYSHQNVRSVELNLPALPKGVFLLKVTTGTNTFTTKVLTN